MNGRLPSDLARILTDAVVAAHPRAFCCTCLAKKLTVDELRLRDCAQVLLVRERRRFFLGRRPCPGCREVHDVFGLKALEWPPLSRPGGAAPH